MSYKIYKNIASSSNYGNKRNLSDIKYIVLHYTGNKNDTAKANANYFKSPNRNASAHYFVDTTSVYQSVEDNVIAWSVGGSKYQNVTQTGGGSFYKICTNSNSISVEICSTNGTFSDDTLENASKLVRKLMSTYNIGIPNVIRHFDVTGKDCPAYWNGEDKNEKDYKRFRDSLIAKEICDDAATIMHVKTAGDPLNCHKTKDLSSSVIGVFKNGKRIKVIQKISPSVYKVKAKNIHGLEISGYVASGYLQ